MLTQKARPSRKSLRVSPECWSRRFNSNQVPLIPASRRHNYANDLPPPSSWLPPFFASTFTCAQEQNSTALEAVPPLRCEKLVSNIHQIVPFQRLPFFSPLPNIVFVLYFLCSSAIHLGRIRVPFPRDFRPRSSRRDKGVRVKERVWSFPLCPTLLDGGTRQ